MLPLYLRSIYAPLIKFLLINVPFNQIHPAKIPMQYTYIHMYVP